VRKGWQTYLDNPVATNEKMAQLNHAMDLKTFAESAKAQKALIEQKDAPSLLGKMTRSRWEELSQQLKSLGLVKNASPATEVFLDL
jgi:phage terminase small subunit